MKNIKLIYNILGFLLIILGMYWSFKFGGFNFLLHIAAFGWIAKNPFLIISILVMFKVDIFQIITDGFDYLFNIYPSLENILFFLGGAGIIIASIVFLSIIILLPILKMKTGK